MLPNELPCVRRDVPSTSCASRGLHTTNARCLPCFYHAVRSLRVRRVRNLISGVTARSTRECLHFQKYLLPLLGSYQAFEELYAPLVHHYIQLLSVWQKQNRKTVRISTQKFGNAHTITWAFHSSLQRRRQRHDHAQASLWKCRKDWHHAICARAMQNVLHEVLRAFRLPIYLQYTLTCKMLGKKASRGEVGEGQFQWPLCQNSDSTIIQKRKSKKPKV